MGKRKKNQRQQHEKRRFRVRGERRDPPDLRKLGKALISLAQAEDERLAQVEHEAQGEQREDRKGHDTQEGKSDA